jgi:prepilin-type N-terminal cleavage/methylation domain-containing protein
MQRNKGFSLIELLIVVAIILIIAALAIPSFLRSKIAANESAAAAAIRIVTSAQISYSSAYPSVGFSSSLAALGGTSCSPPTPASACIIDDALASGQRSGYNFVVANVSGTPATSYNVLATPSAYNSSGVRNFCAYEDSMLRYSFNPITTCDNTITPQQ